MRSESAAGSLREAAEWRVLELAALALAVLRREAPTQVETAPGERG